MKANSEAYSNNALDMYSSDCNSHSDNETEENHGMLESSNRHVSLSDQDANTSDIEMDKKLCGTDKSRLSEA